MRRNVLPMPIRGITAIPANGITKMQFHCVNQISVCKLQSLASAIPDAAASGVLYIAAPLAFYLLAAAILRRT